MAVLIEDSRKIFGTGTVESKSFSIADGPEMFMMFSDGLYPNKIKAVMRELTTNAVDAHIESKTDKKPYIHLPSMAEPYFEIRDFGPGLCHEDMMNLYTTYGLSTKTKTNETTGCFGLGSKSPFAYTDNFVVSSFFNGELRNYNGVIIEGRPNFNVWLDEDGSPKSFKTDEHSGLKIKFAVKHKDISEFHNQAINLYRYFSHDLDIVNTNGISQSLSSIKNDMYSVKGEGWFVRKDNNDAFMQSGPRAIMGNVCYPIEYSALKDLSPIQSKVVRSNIDIQFNIGELRITPSREALSYGEKTIAKVVERINATITSCNNTINKSFADCKTMYEARLKLVNIKLNNTLLSLCDENEFKWNGEKITTSFQKTDDVTVAKFEYDYKFKKNLDVCTINVGPSVEFFESDIPRGIQSRAEHYINKTNKIVYVLTFNSTTAKTDFLKKLGADASILRKMSDLPAVSSKGKSGSRYSNSSQVLELIPFINKDGLVMNRRDREGAQYGFWKTKDVDLNDGGVYIEICRSKPRDGSHPREVQDALELLSKCGHKELTVIGVRSQVAEDFRKSDDWVDFNTYVKNYINTILMKDENDVCINNSIHLWNNRDRIEYYTRIKVSDVDEGYMKKVLSHIAYLQSKSSKLGMHYCNAIRDICSKFKIQRIDKDEVKGWLDKLSIEYPMFVLNDSYGSFSPNNENQDKKAVIDYVNLVDKSKATA